MSKRYGRNQRRRDRQRIADLEWELERLAGRLGIADEAGYALGHRLRMANDENARLANRLRAQEAHVREIAKVINEVVDHSALLPPSEYRASESLRRDNPLRIRLVPRRRFLPPLHLSEPPTIENVKIDILELDLWLLRTTIEENDNEFQRFVHVIVPGPKGATYRVSESAYQQFLRSAGAPEVARMIYGQIVEVLRNQK